MKSRAKNKKTGEEVKGYHCVVEGRHFIIPDDAKISTYKWRDSPKVDLTGLVEVIPETVGRETGLKDKNGTKMQDVWEGDIFIINENDDDWYDVVIWDKRKARFELGHFRSPVTDVSLHTAIKSNNCRVVGNCTDNPELLK